ncbi:HAMP domain-containing histidine kinase [bacterium]|nr:HAMP domain-containing histidine kinase [bacterium]
MIRKPFKKQLINSFFLILSLFLVYYIVMSISYNYLLFSDFKSGNKNILNNVSETVFQYYETYKENEKLFFEYEIQKIKDESAFIDNITILDAKNKIIYPKNNSMKSKYFSDIKDETYKTKHFTLFYKKMIFSGKFYYKGTVIIKINILPYVKHQYAFLLFAIVLLFILFSLLGSFTLKKYKQFLEPMYEFIKEIEQEDDENVQYENEIDLFTKKLENYKKENLEFTNKLDRKTKELFIENKRVQNLLNFRNKMISSTSHELKIPLSIIIGYIEQIKINPDKYMKKGMFYIDKNLKRLQNMIDNLMRLFVVEESKYTLNITKNSLLDLLDELYNEYLPQMENREIRFVLGKPEMDIEIEFDFEEIRLALANMLNNSVRYIKENGKIELYCRVLKDKLHLGVKDNGKGIEKEKLNKIFDWYFQVDQHPSIGIGIGLAIAKNTADAHNWKIEAKSSLNMGANIYLIIPLIMNDK